MGSTVDPHPSAESKYVAGCCFPLWDEVRESSSDNAFLLARLTARPPLCFTSVCAQSSLARSLESPQEVPVHFARHGGRCPNEEMGGHPIDCRARQPRFFLPPGFICNRSQCSSFPPSLSSPPSIATSASLPAFQRTRLPFIPPCVLPVRLAT